jgi:N-acylneuraminate cytidylyltransferase
MNIAIIPARGGSKRIPGKNIKNFLGKPIISYSIEAALDSGIFDEVMVSTDCEKIADTAKEFGASVPFMRSVSKSDDYATTAEVLTEVISEYEANGKSYEWLCCIYPTAPFVTVDKLCTALDLLQQHEADALIPIVPFSYPPQRGLVVENSFIEMKFPENINKCSQDLDKLYHDSGQFYFARTKVFLAENSLFCKRTTPMVLSELEVQDIDNEIDWKLAELKYQLMTNT